MWVIDPPESESTSVNGMGSQSHEISAPSVPQHSGAVLEENRAEHRMELRSSPTLDSANTCQVLLEGSEVTLQGRSCIAILFSSLWWPGVITISCLLAQLLFAELFP